MIEDVQIQVNLDRSMEDHAFVLISDSITGNCELTKQELRGISKDVLTTLERAQQECQVISAQLFIEARNPRDWQKYVEYEISGLSCRSGNRYALKTVEILEAQCRISANLADKLRTLIREISSLPIWTSGYGGTPGRKLTNPPQRGITD